MGESLLSAVRQKRKQQKPSEQATEAFLREHVDDLRELIAYWRVYPDRLIDFYCSLNPNNNFKLFFYQRLFLSNLRSCLVEIFYICNGPDVKMYFISRC